MKHLIPLIALLFPFAAATAGSASLFKLDEETVRSELADLARLEQFVSAHDLTLSEIINNECPLAADLGNYSPLDIVSGDYNRLGGTLLIITGASIAAYGAVLASTGVDVIGYSACFIGGAAIIGFGFAVIQLSPAGVRIKN